MDPIFRIGAGIGIVAFLGGMSPAWAGFARVEKIEGLVDMRGPGKLDWEPVTLGEKLSEGTTLRTGPHGTVQLLTDRGHRLRMKPDTVFSLFSLQDNQTAGRLEQGRVYSKVRHLQAQEQFSIQTPMAVCAVRGTEFLTASEPQGTWVAVFKGVVALSALGSSAETPVRAGQMSGVRNGSIDVPRPISSDNSSRGESGLARDARHEVGLDMSRNAIIAAAAYEQRMADYVEGKSLIDVNGNRVRLEEYIMRPQPDQFKFVVLNERAGDQLDYFYYLGTFNTTLPADLSVALNQLSGTYGSTAPTYYLTSYDMGQSNTNDTVHDTGAGGHLVQITVDASGDYVLTDPTNPSNTRTIPATQLQSDGTYKIYNPLADSFSTVTSDQLSAATKFGFYIPENDTFRDLAPGDTIWKTRFNSYTHALDGVDKITYAKIGSNNVLSTTYDAATTYAGGSVTPVTTVDANKIDATITNYYGDGTFESYRTVLIDDAGMIAPSDAFSGLSTGAAYKSELLKWNYEQQVTASEFEGRKIDLVVEPKIFIKSGLIQ